MSGDEDWPVTDLSHAQAAINAAVKAWADAAPWRYAQNPDGTVGVTVAAEVDRLARDMADVFMGRPIAPCAACGHVPQSWRQPRVPRSDTETGQERPSTESTHESPRETGEQP